MRKFQRNEDFGSRSVHVAELTTGQLVSFICVGLVALAVVFGLGVMVGKLDPSTGTSEVKPEAVQQPATETYTIPAVAEGENAAAATEGESGVTPTGAKRNPEKSKPQNPFTDISPRMSSLDPLPANRPKNIQVEAPSRAPQPDTPDTAVVPAKEGETAASTTQPTAAAPSAGTNQAAPPAAPPTAATVPNTATASPATPATPAQPQTTAAAPAKEAPVLTPITPEEPPIEDLPLEPVPQTVPTSPAAPAAAAPVSGKFVIQLVSFRGEDRRTSAEALKERVKKNSGLNAEVIPSPDDTNYRVVVVGYPDKQSAEKALGDVRTKTGFKDAFIKSL